jgi:hypothetical protein
MSALMLAVSGGSLVGILIWGTTKAIAGVFIISPKTFVAAIAGAATSMVGFGLFALVLGLLGPMLSVVYEEWTMSIAPVIGGTVGAAISSGLAVRVIYIVAIGALTGGVTLMSYRLIRSRERVALKAIADGLIAGVGFGAINGVIVGVVFKLLEVGVGIGWMLAG